MRNSVDRFRSVVRAAHSHAEHRFRAAIAADYDLFVTLFVFHAPSVMEYEAEHLAFGWYFAAGQIARQIGILPGSVGDISQLVANHYHRLPGAADINSQAMAFVASAAAELRALCLSDPAAWQAALAAEREANRCRRLDHCRDDPRETARIVDEVFG